MNAKQKTRSSNSRIEKFNRSTPPPVEPDPPRDRFGTWEKQCKALALEFGQPWRDVVEEWHERAACRTYLGGFDEETANALAFGDVRERLERL